MLDGRTPREPAQSVVQRRRSESIVGSHLPTLAVLQAQVANLTAQAQHSVRVGERADRQLQRAEETLDRIAEARAALARAGNVEDGRVADVQRSLASLEARVTQVKALIERQAQATPARAGARRKGG